MKKLLLLVVCVFFTHTTFAQDEFRYLTEKDLKTYVENISGRFSSYNHTLRDSTRSDVLIRTIPYKQVNDTTFLYTQQGEFYDGTFYPYRQRIYKVFLQNKLTIGLKIYALPSDDYYQVMREIDTYPSFQNDISFAVDYQKLHQLTESDLVPKVGCDIFIWKDNLGGYRGETNENNCKGSFRGSNFTTTEFVVYPHEIISWERGWTDYGEQRWGPKNGPYIYSKINQQ